MKKNILGIAMFIVSMVLTGSTAFGAQFNQTIPSNIIIVQKDTITNDRTFGNIQDAINSITDASEGNRYLVKVMPGIYAEQVVMKEFVDLEGSGQDNTVITSSAIDDGTRTVATVAVPSNVVIRNLSAANTASSTGIWKQTLLFRDATAKAEHITVISRDADDVNSQAIYIDGASDVELNNVTIMTSSIRAFDNIGLYVNTGNALLTNSKILADGGEWNPAVRCSGTLRIQNAILESRNAVHNRTISHSSNVAILGSQILSTNGLENTRGISGSSSITVMNSEIRATSPQGEVVALRGGPYSIGSSLVQGNTTMATAKLVNCWDENFDPILNQ